MLRIKKFISREALNNMMRLFAFIPDKQYLQIMYRIRMGKKLNLDNPQTFNEKLQWLKLYDRRPEYTIMVDKYEAKKYVADRIGSEYIIPTLGVWDKFDDIDFDKLPNQFVLKCTHDSGGLVICRDKKTLDIQEARKKIEKSLKSNFFWVGREWPYKNVKPRIIAEEYMEDETDHELRDYKFFAFDGVAKALFIATDRGNLSSETKFDFFDIDFNHLDFTNGHPNSEVLPHKPKTFDEMKKLAEKLSCGIPQVRVDFYEVNGKAYFGELTFAHWSGMKPFDPEIWDKKFGEMIELPENSGGYLILNRGYVLYLHEKAPRGLRDYKVFCFNGKAEFMYLPEGMENHSTARVNYVNLNWTPSRYRRRDYREFEVLPPKPKHLDEMIKLAEKLSNGVDFVRVDFYEINGRVYFGELTFFPGNGFTPFASQNDDVEIGQMLDLNSIDN